jgi:hypothetical protein
MPFSIQPTLIPVRECEITKMGRKTIVCLLVLVVLSVAVAPVMAHGDEEHPPGDLERVVAGAGIILITLSLASLFLAHRPSNGESISERNPSQTEIPERDG